MSDDSLFELLQKVGFRLTREVLDKLISECTKQRLSPVQVMERLVEVERRARDGVNLAYRMRVAMLGVVAGIETFDWSHPRKIDRELYEELFRMDFIERSENVLFRGSVGLGKTMLAKNLGLEALRRGHTVRFTTLASMTADVLRQESIPAAARRLRRYTHPALLVIDELGYLPLDSRAADVLYNVVAARHENTSTIMTTNLGFKAWGGVFGEAGSLVALIDRFTQHLHVMDIEGDSYRDPRNKKPGPAPGRSKRARKR
jgi:DNA replication protein DnaC